MGKALSAALVAAFVLLSAGVHGATPAKKKSSARVASKSTVTRKGKKAPVGTAPARQMAPSSNRYREIQSALVAKGYLPADQANGQWNDASADALKRFQSDQNLDPTGKINSISLIALGLGPKHDANTAVSSQ